MHRTGQVITESEEWVLVKWALVIWRASTHLNKADSISLNVLCSRGRIGRARILDFCEKSPDIKTEKRFKTDFLLVLFNINSSNKQTLYGRGKVCPQVTTLGALFWASEMLRILSAQTLKGCITGSHIFPWKYIIYKSQYFQSS